LGEIIKKKTGGRKWAAQEERTQKKKPKNQHLTKQPEPTNAPSHMWLSEERKTVGSDENLPILPEKP